MGVLSVTRGTYSPMGRGVFHPRPVLKPSEAVLGGSRAVPGRFLERETGGGPALFDLPPVLGACRS